MSVILPSNPGTEIKVWMLRNEIIQSDVSRALGYKLSGGAVSHFLRGSLYLNRIATYLKDSGCPPHLLEELKEYHRKKIMMKNKKNRKTKK